MRQNEIRGDPGDPSATGEAVTTITGPNPHFTRGLVARRFDQGVRNAVCASATTYLATRGRVLMNDL